MLKVKKLSKVYKLEDHFWVDPGVQGHYSDTDAQEERETLDELRDQRWEDVVARRFAEKHPWLYSIITDRGRSLFLNFLPLKQDGIFLDVGSGWGQVAIPLSRQGEVFCLDVTIPRLKILKEIASQEQRTLNYICGNYRTFPFDNNQFDAVIFNGTLEWIALGMVVKTIRKVQQEALLKTFNILKPGGYVYIGIENALGLKYLLGVPDDHTSLKYVSLLDEESAQAEYSKIFGNKPLPAKTWSLAEYKKLVADAGLEIVEIYGCFPDYKLIRHMIPLSEINATLAENGLLHPEHSGVDGSNLPNNELLDATYRQLARNQIAQYFCPSFGIIARKPE
jgi:SAM-dependent methyltransferase